MSEHYTSNTVEVKAWCNKCRQRTMHSVSGHRLGHCLVCFERQTKEAQERPSTVDRQPSTQGDLFR